MRVLQTERKLFKLIGIISLCLIGGIATEALALDKAGVSAAVRGQVARANDEHPVGQQVASGEPIYLADRITSGPGAGMQIMLLDQTTFTIGPDSFVRIDEFVYDPNTNVGKVTATLGKGVFRFVTGKIAAANPSNMTVKLPNATIGIRGTMVIGSTDGERTVVGLVGPGPENNTHDKVAGIDVITPNGTAEIRRPGWGAIVEHGQAPQVQQLPKTTVDGILNGVAPRNVAQSDSSGGSNSPQTQPPSQSGSTSTRSANNASGQSSAGAGPTVDTFKTAGGDPPGGPAAISAAQQGSLGPITTFEQLRSITSGTAIFTQNNVPIIGDGGSGSYNFQLFVDFGAQKAKGDWTNINFSGTHFSFDGPASIGFGNGVGSDSGSYSDPNAFTGPITCVAGSAHDCSGHTSGNCNNPGACAPGLIVRNSGSNIGAIVEHSLTVSGNGHSASGGGTITR